MFQGLFFITHFTENTDFHVGIAERLKKLQITQSTLPFRLLFTQQKKQDNRQYQSQSNKRSTKKSTLSQEPKQAQINTQYIQF